MRRHKSRSQRFGGGEFFSSIWAGRAGITRSCQFLAGNISIELRIVGLPLGHLQGPTQPGSASCFPLISFSSHPLSSQHSSYSWNWPSSFPHSHAGHSLCLECSFPSFQLRNQIKCPQTGLPWPPAKWPPDTSYLITGFVYLELSKLCVLFPPAHKHP